ncbi:MAG: HlyD family efflux transporter periplasmic adaptor subunit, partial [Rhizorhabdus sp.]
MRGLMSAGLLAMAFTLSGCGAQPESHEPHEAPEHGAAAEDYERGPHRGRMLRDGNFAVEVTIFEDGAEPEFRLYAYRDDKPIAPADVRIALELKRLGGEVDRFAFRPEGDVLRGNGIVREPHSFDVTVTATEGGRRHRWSYASYEGRTTIAAAAAAAGGVRSERAGPATIDERIDMSGRIEITPEGKAEVRAWYPGRVLAMRAQLGDRVAKGQALARVESSHSLQSYTIPAPIGGIIVEKNANVGAMTGDRPLFVVADPAMLHAEFFVYPRDAERIRVGQAVALRSLSG